MVETLVDYNDHKNSPLSNEKIQQAVSKVMAETEDEKRDAECNTNNVTMDTLFQQYPVTTNTQEDIANVTNERRISSNIMAETIRGFKRLTLQSTIKDSAYHNSEEDVTKINPNNPGRTVAS